jgi:hypothetical protein
MRDKWYAKPDDLIGGWCVMDTDMTPGEANRPEIACFISEKLARHIAYLHNQWVYEGCEEDMTPVKMVPGKKYGTYHVDDHVSFTVCGVITKGTRASNYVEVQSGPYFGLPYGDKVTVHFEMVSHLPGDKVKPW